MFRTGWETLKVFAELNAFQGAIFQCIVVVNVYIFQRQTHKTVIKKCYFMYKYFAEQFNM